MTSPADLPPLPDADLEWRDFDGQYRYGYSHQAMTNFALAARAELEAEVERLRGLVREYIDDFPLTSLRRACSERWGLTLDEISNLEHSNNELTEQLAQWDELGAQLESAHGMLQHELAENAIFRRRAEAAEARVKELEHQLELAEHDSVSQSQLYAEYTEEWAKERDALRARVEELQEKLMVMCVAQINKLDEPVSQVIKHYDKILKTLLDGPLDPEADFVMEISDYLILRAQFVPSPAPPAPAPLAAQGVEGEPHGRESR